jgi:hypothetical protein
MDASAGNGELQPVGMTFAALESNDWAKLSPRDLAARLHNGMFIPASLQPLQNTSTFAFRTREGGTGLLQFVGFEPDRPGVSLRYKLVNRPTPLVAK